MASAPKKIPTLGYMLRTVSEAMGLVQINLLLPLTLSRTLWSFATWQSIHTNASISLPLWPFQF